MASVRGVMSITPPVKLPIYEGTGMRKEREREGRLGDYEAKKAKVERVPAINGDSMTVYGLRLFMATSPLLLKYAFLHSCSLALKNDLP